MSREPRKKLLVLDDDAGVVDFLCESLAERGFDATGFRSPTDALARIKAESFDLVITDVEMPNMDGFTLTTRIRQDARYRELPIILVTSLASDEHRRQGIEAGANAYVTKNTFDQKALLDTLRRLV